MHANEQQEPLHHVTNLTLSGRTKPSKLDIHRDSMFSQNEMKSKQPNLTRNIITVHMKPKSKASGRITSDNRLDGKQNNENAFESLRKIVKR